MSFEKNTIGLVGHGFVGEALEVGMKHKFDVIIYDPIKYPAIGAIRHDSRFLRGKEGDIEVVDCFSTFTSRAEIIFVAVPTPMNEDGSSCTSIVEKSVERIASYGNNNVVVIKSTVPPGTTKALHDKWAGKGIEAVVFNPEFLTEANYIEDFKKQTRIIIGCEDDKAKAKVKTLYQKAYPQVQTVKTNPTIAEMVKYTTNCFLATKLSFANELAQICRALEIDYDKVIEYFLYDERVGKSHLSVPGGDGDYGWGLSCFPKDLNAMIAVSKKLGVDPKVMKSAWEKNLEVRKNRDWEKMKKAVVNVKAGDS